MGRDSRELGAKKEAVAEEELAVKFVLAALSILLLGDSLARGKAGGGVGESEEAKGEPKKAAVLLPLEFVMLGEGFKFGDASRGEGKGEGRRPSFTCVVKTERDFFAFGLATGDVKSDTLETIDALEILEARSRSSGGIGVGSRDQAYIMAATVVVDEELGRKTDTG